MHEHLRHGGPQSEPPSHLLPRSRNEGRFARGFRLARLSWNVIERDRSLLALPMALLLTQAVAAALIFLPTGLWAADGHSTRPLLLAAALAAFPFNFLSTFFGVAFVAVLRAHYAGEEASLRDGLAFARSRLGAIAGWAALTTLVGLAIRALERVRGGALAAWIAGWVLGAAWALATIFAVPVLASTDLGALATARESAQVVRKRWGETVAGGSLIGVAFGFLMIPVVIVGVIGFTSFDGAPAFGFVALVIAIALGLVLIAAQFAVETVFRVALFDFATAETVQAPFTRSDLEAGLRPKRRLLKRGR